MTLGLGPEVVGVSFTWLEMRPRIGDVVALLSDLATSLELGPISRQHDGHHWRCFLVAMMLANSRADVAAASTSPSFRPLTISDMSAENFTPFSEA